MRTCVWYLAGAFGAEVSWVGERMSVHEDRSIVEAAYQIKFSLFIHGKNDQTTAVSFILPLHTFTFSTALSWWLVRVAAVSIAWDPGADNVPSVTVARATRVVAISKLSAICIFFTMIHAACKQTIENTSLGRWPSLGSVWSVDPLQELLFAVVRFKSHPRRTCSTAAALGACSWREDSVSCHTERSPHDKCKPHTYL